LIPERYQKPTYDDAVGVAIASKRMRKTLGIRATRSGERTRRTRFTNVHKAPSSGPSEFLKELTFAFVRLDF
jgi:hypothetical protein